MKTNEADDNNELEVLKINNRNGEDDRCRALTVSHSAAAATRRGTRTPIPDINYLSVAAFPRDTKAFVPRRKAASRGSLRIKVAMRHRSNPRWCWRAFPE